MAKISLPMYNILNDLLPELFEVALRMKKILKAVRTHSNVQKYFQKAKILLRYYLWLVKQAFWCQSERLYSYTYAFIA